jgi:hypothetical protein
VVKPFGIEMVAADGGRADETNIGAFQQRLVNPRDGAGDQRIGIAQERAVYRTPWRFKQRSELRKSGVERSDPLVGNYFQ